jgi:hypothetical protein
VFEQFCFGPNFDELQNLDDVQKYFHCNDRDTETNACRKIKLEHKKSKNGAVEFESTSATWMDRRWHHDFLPFMIPKFWMHM